MWFLKRCDGHHAVDILGAALRDLQGDREEIDHDSGVVGGESY
jgi:hypothetical protein